MDAEGNPLIVLAWCGDASPEAVVISHHEDSTGPLSAWPAPSSSATVADDVTLSGPPSTAKAQPSA